MFNHRMLKKERKEEEREIEREVEVKQSEVIENELNPNWDFKCELRVEMYSYSVQRV